MPILLVVPVFLFLQWIIGSTWFWYTLGGAAVLVVGFMVYGFWYATTPAGIQAAAEHGRQQRLKEERKRLPKDFGDGPRFEGKRAGLAVDTDGKKVGIFSGSEWLIYPFADILGGEVDVKENGVTRTTSSRSLVGAAVGGLAFGAAGAVVGGLGGKTTSITTAKRENLTLKIMVRDMNHPVRTVEFGVYSAMTATWTTGDRDLGVAHEWLTRIKLIVDENERRMSGRMDDRPKSAGL